MGRKLTFADKREIALFTAIILLVAAATGMDTALKIITPWSLSCYLYLLIYNVFAIGIRDPRSRIITRHDWIFFGLVCLVLVGFVYIVAVMLLVRPLTIFEVLYKSVQGIS